MLDARLIVAEKAAMRRFRRRPDVSITSLDDSTFLVDPGTQEIFHLDALGGGIWSALSEPASRDELVALLADAFPETPHETIARDLDGLLAELVARELVIED
jgi:hypothetical protein